MEGYNHNLFKAREVLVGEFNLAVTESIRMDMNKIGIFKYEKMMGLCGSKTFVHGRNSVPIADGKKVRFD